MISIASELDAHDIAQEIRQERQVHKGAFLLLEGDRDIKRFGKFVDEGACSVQNCFGRDNLLGAVEILIDEGFPGVLGLADSDFDRLDGCLQTNEAIIFSRSHDFDLEIACSDVLRRYLAEVGHREKCEAHGGHQEIRRWLFDACKPLSVFRYLSHGQSLGYRLDQIKHRDICMDWSVDVDLLIEHVSTGRFSADRNKQEMKQLVRNHTAQEFDFQQITNGHDFCALVGLALQGKLADRKPPQAWSSEVEIHFRLAFSEADFIRMPVFDEILDWQRENEPYVVLKASLRKIETRVLH